MQSRIKESSDESLFKLFDAIRKLDPRQSAQGSTAKGSTEVRSITGSLNKTGNAILTESEATAILPSADICSLYGEIVEQIEPAKVVQHLEAIQELLPQVKPHEAEMQPLETAGPEQFSEARQSQESQDSWLSNFSTEAQKDVRFASWLLRWRKVRPNLNFKSSQLCLTS